ncbi:sensor histidine kinase [Pedobacter frigiditerrae]|uniref:sensor histidine kinase n=1 Tax=Pedobacter frigiditerrae TaxID=2530452 RepID=UPI0029308444|nr:ATP-binding protein [Pedobacter frigiditerrae]
MYKLLFVFFLTFFVNTAVFAQDGASQNAAKNTSYSDQDVNRFYEYIRYFNDALKLNSKKTAKGYLLLAENQLMLMNALNEARFCAEMALGYARIGDKKKAIAFQQKATMVSRGKTIILSIKNLNHLAQSFVLTNDTTGLKRLFDKAISTASKTEKKTVKIAYVNGLFGVDENVKASTLLNELYTDTPLPENERAEILNLLIINSIKLKKTQYIDKYYQELEQLKPSITANYLLAKGMYFELKNQYANASKTYQLLVKDFNAGKRENVYLEGVLQLAQLVSKQLKKDSANYYFVLLEKAIIKPFQSTAIGIRYLKFFNAHQTRFKSANSTAIDKAINTKDSLYKNELIAVTKELQYKHKIEEDKQKAELLKRQRDIAKQRSVLIIGGLCLLVIIAGTTIYILYQRRKQANLLHLAEVERLKQVHKTDIIKKLSATQEAERWRIADQLHDEVGSMISVVRLNLSEHPFKKEPITPEKLETANRILADVANTVREMSHELMPVAIRQYGLINAIEQLINDINTSGKLYIEHLIYGFDDLSKYPEDFQVSFYRIVQELFQNIVKHAKATNAIFQLVEHPDSINLYIEDNGKGIEKEKADKTGKGIGLLANRIDYYEGKISIEGQPGKGTLIVIDIPTEHMVGEQKN